MALSLQARRRLQAGSGAKAWKSEEAKLVNSEHTVYVKLKKENDKRFLHTNAYEYLKCFRCGIINSDILGAAFEPEERFENPDGTAIILRRGLSKGTSRPFHIDGAFRLCGGGFSS